MAIWRAGNEGCYADGTHGHGHVRKVLASLLLEVEVIKGEETLTLRRELSGPSSVDLAEEDEALDLLNTACDGCFFYFDGGDLMLGLKRPPRKRGENHD